MVMRCKCEAAPAGAAFAGETLLPAAGDGASAGRARRKASATSAISATSTQASRREALLLLAALGVGTTAETAQAQDPVRSEPRNYKVLFDNPKVRVLEYTARPGLGVCGAGKHWHPDHVTIVLTPAKVRVDAGDGKTVIKDIPAGTTIWAPAATHTSENVGGSDTRMVIVEIKDKDWKPATG